MSINKLQIKPTCRAQLANLQRQLATLLVATKNYNTGYKILDKNLQDGLG